MNNIHTFCQANGTLELEADLKVFANGVKPLEIDLKKFIPLLEQRSNEEAALNNLSTYNGYIMATKVVITDEDGNTAEINFPLAQQILKPLTDPVKHTKTIKAKGRPGRGSYYIDRKNRKLKELIKIFIAHGRSENTAIGLAVDFIAACEIKFDIPITFAAAKKALYQ